MTDPRPAAESAGNEPAVPSTHPPAPHSRWAYGLLGGLLLALGFGGWGVWTTVSRSSEPGAVLARQQAEVERLEQQVATLSRSDQISRDANRDLQAMLAERDEEIAALRADVAFYERFVGSTSQRRGLTVHELDLRPQPDTQAWHFVATLTQNLNRDSPSTGRLTLSVEGTRDGRLQRLSWADLRQQPDAPGREYSFKYFQRIEGDIVLPPGFMPLRANVRLAPASGTAVEQTFPWADTSRSAAGG